MAEDTGIKATAVTATGVSVSTVINNSGARQVTVYNSGSAYIYANLNSTTATVIANIAAGSGAIPIAAGGDMTWRGVNIQNVCLATATGESSTADIAACADTI